ncbi:hypothetical protein [Robertkochia aurantiaca]|uniref:hypothetical protein n=1 Tax=Robertkochia aurantiaca TaxID=2873700 RepID=UPI001CC936E2|nr:hypothetical protein [Robertkochia sp. 3YJGBD-33]
MLYQRLIDKIEAAPELDFGDLFSASIELFKKSWLQGFIFTLLSFLLVLPAILIIYIPMLGGIAMSEYSESVGSDFESFWAIFPFLLLFFPVMLLAQSIILALTAGFYKLLRRLDEGAEVVTGELFVFLKWEYIKKAFVLALMTTIISIVASLLCVLPAFYVMVPVYLVAVFFAFNSELSPVEILKASFKLGNRKWLILFGLIIICSLLAQLVGAILCGIGVLFTAPFVYHPLYLVYKKVVGFSDNNIEVITE